jgi:HAD superfamily hydrolase (TIGR01459 family)
VVTLLDRLAFPREAYDAVVTSGDVTRTIIAGRASQSVFHIGPPRDVPIFDGLDTRLVPLERADYVVCSGLYDDTVETPRDYEKLIAELRARGLTMLCANPDVVVERGDKLVYCAGAIADLYVAAGGEVIFAGKPYRPIYEQALATARALRGGAGGHERLLAIGDSVRTDLAGAAAFGIDCLFVTGGIHAEELGRDAPDAKALAEMFVAAGSAPRAVTPRLVW